MPLAMSPVLSARAPTPRLARPATASRRPASVGSRVAARREWLPRWAPRAMATDAAEVGGSPDEDGEEKAAAEGPQRPVVAAAAEKEAAGQTEEANGEKGGHINSSAPTCGCLLTQAHRHRHTLTRHSTCSKALSLPAFKKVVGGGVSLGSAAPLLLTS